MVREQNFVRQVSDCIRRHHLIAEGEKALVALSGGADSVALLRVLLDIGIRCEAVHCNFRLRGAESDRDEQFVRTLCRQLGIELHVNSFATAHYAEKHGISIEMAARELRYDYFETLRQQRGAACVVVAHHRDDNVETLLLNLLRGTGIHGLTGIHYRHGSVVRPMLDVGRNEILHYLAALKQSYVTDSTNLEDDVLRNKLRLNVLPLLAEINPSVASTLQQTIIRMADVALIYDEAVGAMKKRVQQGDRVSIQALQKETAPRTLLYEILQPHGFSSVQVADIYEQLGGDPGRIYESTEWRLLRDRDFLYLRRKSEEFACFRTVLPLQGEVEVAPGIRFVIRRYAISEGYELKRDKRILCADMEKLQFPLTVRLFAEGDRFCPFGMKGSKLVSNYLTDAKYSVFDKERQLVICSGNDIVWLVGERSDNRFRIDSQTRFVLQVDAVCHSE